MALRNKSFCPQGDYVQVAAITLLVSLLGLAALHEIMEGVDEGVWGEKARHYQAWFYSLGVLVVLAAWATAYYGVRQQKKKPI